MNRAKRWLYISYYFSCFDRLFFSEINKGGIQSACKLPEFILRESSDEILFIFIVTDYTTYLKLSKVKNVYPIYSKTENSFSSMIKLFLLTLWLIFKFKMKIDVIYSVGYLSIISSLISRVLGIRHFGRFYGTFLSLYYEKNVKNFKLLLEWLSIKLSKDGVIVTDDGTKGNKVLEMMNIPKHKILFIPNGIDKEAIYNIIKNLDKNFEKEKLGLNRYEFIITNISRLARWKRVDLVIRAFHCLLEKYPNLNDKIALLIVGDGNCREELVELVRNLKLHDVYFLGNVSWEESIKYIYISDFITSFYEVSNVGNVLIESLTIGRCVLARDTGDTGKVIENLKNGILLPQEEDELIKSFIFNINMLIKDINKLREIEKQARILSRCFLSWQERVKKEYDWIIDRL